MSAQLLHVEGRFIDTDSWTVTEADAALPAGPVLVTLDRWRAEREALLARPAPLGVVLEPGQPLEELAADLPRIACIALRFPSPGEGRPYSAARLLRERYGYRGEIRAIGEVLIDQVYFLKRSGFESLALRADQDPQAALSALQAFSVRYQPAWDEALPLYRRRAAG